LRGLHAAFGPESAYGRANTRADILADWIDFRALEPGADLNAFALLLVDHEVRRWGTPALPLLRRVVAALRRAGARGPAARPRPHARPGP
jgi:hypothetical protein